MLRNVRAQFANNAAYELGPLPAGIAATVNQYGLAGKAEHSQPVVRFLQYSPYVVRIGAIVIAISIRHESLHRRSDGLPIIVGSIRSRSDHVRPQCLQSLFQKALDLLVIPALPATAQQHCITQRIRHGIMQGMHHAQLLFSIGDLTLSQPSTHQQILPFAHHQSTEQRNTVRSQTNKPGKTIRNIAFTFQQRYGNRPDKNNAQACAGPFPTASPSQQCQCIACSDIFHSVPRHRDSESGQVERAYRIGDSDRNKGQSQIQDDTHRHQKPLQVCIRADESISGEPSQRQHSVKNAYAGGENIDKLDALAHRPDMFSNIAQILCQVR